MKRLKALVISLLACTSVFLSGCKFAERLNSYSITLKTTALNLNVGDEPAPINYIVDSTTFTDFDDTITWSSENETVAKVNEEGFVTAVSEGFTKIIASLKIRPSVTASCDVSVTDTKVLSVSLNATKQNIQQGRSYQLVATVENFKETNEVEWSGSANGISVVDGLVKVDLSATVGDSALIKASSKEDPQKYAICEVVVAKKVENPYAYTLMYYMSASTLEYKNGEMYGLFSDDIIEILSLKGIPSNVKIIIETGGTGKWAMPSSALTGTSSISNAKLQRWEVIPEQSSYSVLSPYSKVRINCFNRLKLVESLPTNYIAAESSLESFLIWGLKNYSADQMGLILSGHGGGVDGCLYDDNYDQKSLNAEQIALASKNALATSDSRDKFTFIGYDCCVMANLDNASVNSDYFDYMIASQEDEIGSGYNHDAYLKSVYADPQISPTALLPLIAKSFVDDTHEKYCPYVENGKQVYCNQTSSVLDLTKLNTVVKEFNLFSEKVTFDKVKTAYKASSLNKFGESSFGLVDANNFLTTYANKNGTDVDAIKTAIKEAVIANFYCDNYKTAPCGLNLFVPVPLHSMSFVQVNKLNYTGNQTKLITWQKMCLDNGSFANDTIIHGGHVW